MNNTLLGYLKNELKKQGETTKYFNREFLAIYITERNDSFKNHKASYPKTMETKFYQYNSTAYCVFLEIFEDYKKKMERAKAIMERA